MFAISPQRLLEGPSPNIADSGYGVKLIEHVPMVYEKRRLLDADLDLC